MTRYLYSHQIRQLKSVNNRSKHESYFFAVQFVLMFFSCNCCETINTYRYRAYSMKKNISKIFFPHSSSRSSSSLAASRTRRRTATALTSTGTSRSDSGERRPATSHVLICTEGQGRSQSRRQRLGFHVRNIFIRAVHACIRIAHFLLHKTSVLVLPYCHF